MARQDGPGSPNFGTTAASQNRLNTEKSTQSLGSTTNQNIQAPAAAFGGGLQVYKYPLDGETDFPARMRFTIKQVDAYTVDTTELKEYWDAPLLKKGWNRLTQSSKKEQILADESRRQQGQLSTYQPINSPRDGGNPGGLQTAYEAKDNQASQDAFASDGTAGVKTRTLPNSPIIQIYMPQSLQVNDDIAYNQADLGPGGLAAGAGLNAGQSLLNAVGRGISEGLESIFNLATGQISGQAAQVAAARVSQKIPSAGLRAAAATALQTGVNPGTRMIFDRPNIRQFTFTFRFIATSQAEASQVENIVRVFREEMYPEEIEVVNGVPAGYKFPNLFQVDFQFLNSKAKFPRMQLSYLRSCQVNYNPNSMSFHADGQPTEIDMTLVFQEYRALSKQDIQKGY